MTLVSLATLLDNAALEYKFHETRELFWFVHCCILSAQKCPGT